MMNGTYGVFDIIDETGQWSYTFNPDIKLQLNDTVTDVFTVSRLNNSLTGNITFTIVATNDKPTITSFAHNLTPGQATFSLMGNIN